MDCEEIPWSSKEAQVLAENQHMEMISGLCQGNSNLAQFMKDKEVIACERDFQFKVDLPFEVKYGDEIYKEIYIVGSIDFIVKDKEGNIHVIDFKGGKNSYKMLKESSADFCKKCGACMKQCPQHINIPEMLEKVKTELGE